jgi:hypothetical protein
MWGDRNLEKIVGCDSLPRPIPVVHLLTTADRLSLSSSHECMDKKFDRSVIVPYNRSVVRHSNCRGWGGIMSGTYIACDLPATRRAASCPSISTSRPSSALRSSSGICDEPPPCALPSSSDATHRPCCCPHTCSQSEPTCALPVRYFVRARRCVCAFCAIIRV